MGAPVESVFQSTPRDEQTTVWGPRHRRLDNEGAGVVIVLGGQDGTPPWPDVGAGQIEWISNLQVFINPAGVEVFSSFSLAVTNRADSIIAFIDTSTIALGAGVVFERAIQPEIALVGGEHFIRLAAAIVPGVDVLTNVSLSWSSIVTIRGNASLY